MVYAIERRSRMMTWLIEMTLLVAHDVARRDRTKPGEGVMTTGLDNTQQAGNGQLNGVDFSSFSTTLQAIFTEGADYTKKSMEGRMAVVEKLLGAKSLETVVQIQSDYAKTAYADFVVQATKMGELHSNLAKAAFKPAEQVIAAMQGTMQGTK
jgi:Phasin protein